MREQVWFAREKHSLAEIAWVCLSYVLAVFLTLLPFYRALGLQSPVWLLMAVLYWRQTWKPMGSIWVFWGLGILMDAITQAPFGCHALGFLILFMLSKSDFDGVANMALFKQAVVLFVLLIVYQCVLAVLLLMAGQAFFSAGFLLQPLVSALLWPGFVLLMRYCHRFTRGALA